MEVISHAIHWSGIHDLCGRLGLSVIEAAPVETRQNARAAWTVTRIDAEGESRNRAGKLATAGSIPAPCSRI